MINRTLAALALATTLAAPAGAQQPAATDRYIGNWQGTLNTGLANLRLGLTITRDAGGALGGVLTSVDQGNSKIPAAVSTAGDSLVIDIPGLQLHYAAVLTAAGDSLRGTFKQGPGMLPLAMGRVAAITVGTPPARPQTPFPPYPYRTEDVSVASAPGVTLAGTLDLPAGAGPFPAVVFVTGSGPQDRDETLLGHRPFLVMADYLARHGIASLRLDDRGTARSTGNFASATTMDFADDAEAAVRWLRSRPEVQKAHVGLIGHSEGGLIAPIVAARSNDVGFIVMLAGPGLRGDSILVLQQRAVLLANGVPEAMADKAASNNGRLFAAMRGAKDSADAEARARAELQAATANAPADQRDAAYRTFNASLPQLLSPWMRTFMAFDPQPTLRAVKVPVLALDGSLDVQVPAKENIPAIEAALKAGGNRDYKVVLMPGLNHLFQTARTGGPAEYEKIEETMSPAVLDLVTTWILAHSGSR